MRFCHKYVITAQDMDPEYLLTPSAVLLYSQDTLAAFLTKWKIAAFDEVKKGLMWVFTDYVIDFGDSRPYWMDEITVEAWLSELSVLKAYFDFRITASDGSLVAEGSTCWSILDIATRKPVSAKEIVEASGMEMDPEAYRHPRAVFPVPGRQLAEYSHHTNASDMDFNGHISNRTYLAVALSGASAQALATHRAKHIRMKFIHETFVGDTLTCTCFLPETTPEGADPQAVEVLMKLTDQTGKEVCRIGSQWLPAVPQPPISEHVVR